MQVFRLKALYTSFHLSFKGAQMLYNYVALCLFAAFAVFLPLSFILTSRLIGRKEHGNPVKNAPYESGEETIGSSRDIDNEYLQYFMLFIPFEIVIAILVLWSTATAQLGYFANLAILSLGVSATIVSLIGYKLSNSG